MCILLKHICLGFAPGSLESSFRGIVRWIVRIDRKVYRVAKSQVRLDGVGRIHSQDIYRPGMQ